MFWKLSLVLNWSVADGVFSEHAMYASSALVGPLAAYFTSLVRHGLVPRCFRDFIVVLVPKKNKVSSCSVNYHPIALASCLSKIMEHLILIKFSSFFNSSSLQFKPSSSTSICTGVVKSIVSHNIHNSSSVLCCFVDASKAFDLVDHSMLFQKLIDRGLPLLVIRFLSFWYSTQRMNIHPKQLVCF